MTVDLNVYHHRHRRIYLKVVVNARSPLSWLRSFCNREIWCFSAAESPGKHWRNVCARFVHFDKVICQWSCGPACHVIFFSFIKRFVPSFVRSFIRSFVHSWFFRFNKDMQRHSLRFSFQQGRESQGVWVSPSPQNGVKGTLISMSLPTFLLATCTCAYTVLI